MQTEKNFEKGFAGIALLLVGALVAAGVVAFNSYKGRVEGVSTTNPPTTGVITSFPQQTPNPKGTLDQAVKNGKITQDQETEILNRLAAIKAKQQELLDLQKSLADWLKTNNISTATLGGRELGGQNGNNGQQPRPTPPQAAFDVCSGKNQGDACTITNNERGTINGTCRSTGDSQNLLCIPTNTSTLRTGSQESQSTQQTQTTGQGQTNGFVSGLNNLFRVFFK